MNSLPLAVVGKIITDGVLIYCRDDKARVDYETIIRSAYFDFLPFIHNYQRTYLEQIAVQSDTKDWKMVSIEKISRKFRKIIMQQYGLT